MKNCILVILIIAMETTSLTVWEFGKKTNDNINVKISGLVPKTTKIKHILMPVIICTSPVYVRVEIENDHGMPRAEFNWDTNAVTLTFPPYQYDRRRLSYNIETQYKRNLHCSYYDDRSFSLREGLKQNPKKSNGNNITTLLSFDYFYFGDSDSAYGDIDYEEA